MLEKKKERERKKREIKNGGSSEIGLGDGVRRLSNDAIDKRRRSSGLNGDVGKEVEKEVEKEVVKEVEKEGEEMVLERKKTQMGHNAFKLHMRDVQKATTVEEKRILIRNRWVL